MENSLYIALLNPAIGLVLATAFLVLWIYQRKRGHIALLAAGYAFSSGGFLLQYFVLPVGPELSKLTSVSLFFASGLCICGAVIGRYDRPLPIAALALLATGGLGVVCWFLFVEPDLTARVYAINFALGGMSLVVAAELRAVPGKSLIDRVIMAVSLLSGLNFFVRTLVAVKFYGAVDPYSDFHGSIYWATVILSHAILSIVIAFALVTATTLEVIAELYREAHTDPLSRLLNRRGFEERAPTMLEQSDRSGQPVSLVLCDLDHFKEVNDSLGHDSGDLVISGFADLLSQMAPEGAVIGRIGGEEFGIILPAASLAVARLFAEGSRSAFAGLAIQGLPAERRFSASFGVAELRRSERLAQLKSRADAALYAAKNDGRNCVRLAVDEPSLAPIRISA